MPPARRRGVWFRIAAVALPLLVLWGIPELIVRAVDPRLDAYTTIRFGNDPASPALFVKDPRLHWKLRSGVDLEFTDVRVRTDEHGFRGASPRSGDRIVLSLGDSSTFGWEMEQSATFSAVFERLLNERARGGRWHVLNGGVPGYSSFQVRVQLERLLRDWDPELVLICIGNNEAWPVSRSDRQIDERHRIRRKATQWLSASRFLVWAAERIRGEERRPFYAASLTDAVPRVDRRQFDDNLTAAVRAAREVGAEVVLLGPPANLFSLPLRAKELAGWEAIEPYNDRLSELIPSGRLDEAEVAVETMIRRHPDDFRAMWLKGAFMASVLDERERGTELLEEAFERHPFPERSPRSYRRTVAEVAAREGVRHLDVNELFRDLTASTRGTRALERLYLDHCHPSVEGHRAIAEALAERIDVSD